MSDLSWLNPTPHAIAVYASQPLSPVATQHSLPSGRYSLLGPDFHRLDRTSFAWRTHSITSSARSRNDSGMVRPSAFAVVRLSGPRSSLIPAVPVQMRPRVPVIPGRLQLDTSARRCAAHGLRAAHVRRP